MILKKALQGYFSIDEVVRQKFNQLAVRLEDKGINRYVGAAIAGGIGIGLYCAGSFDGIMEIRENPTPLNVTGTFVYSQIVLGDFLSNYGLYSLHKEKNTDSTTSSVTALDPVEEDLKKYWTGGKLIRLAQLGTATHYTLQGAIQAYAFLEEGLKTALEHGGDNLAVGIGLFGITTSMYLKDTDKDIIRKDSVFQRTYQACVKLVGKIKNAIKIPELVPAPETAHYSSHQ